MGVHEFKDLMPGAHLWMRQIRQLQDAKLLSTAPATECAQLVQTGIKFSTRHEKSSPSSHGMCTCLRATPTPLQLEPRVLCLFGGRQTITHIVSFLLSWSSTVTDSVAIFQKSCQQLRNGSWVFKTLTERWSLLYWAHNGEVCVQDLGANRISLCCYLSMSSERFHLRH